MPCRALPPRSKHFPPHIIPLRVAKGIEGVAYFAGQNFWVFGNAIVNANSPNVTVIADKIWAQGSATIKITNANPRNLDVEPAPQTAGGVRLIR